MANDPSHLRDDPKVQLGDVTRSTLPAQAAPRLTRLKRLVSEKTSDFLGISEDCDPVNDFSLRRLRLASRRCGDLKCQVPPSDFDSFADVVDAVMSTSTGGGSPMARTPAVCLADTKLSRLDEEEITAIRKLSVRESVPEMAWDGVTALCQRLGWKKQPGDTVYIDTDRGINLQTLTRGVDFTDGQTTPGKSSLMTYPRESSFRRLKNYVTRSRSYNPNLERQVRLPEQSDRQTRGDQPQHLTTGHFRVEEVPSFLSDDVFRQDVIELRRQPTVVSGIQPKSDAIFRASAINKPPTQSRERLPFIPSPDYDDVEQLEYGEAIKRSSPSPRRRVRQLPENRLPFRNRVVNAFHRIQNFVIGRPSVKNKRLIGQGIVMDIFNDAGYHEKIWQHPELIFQIRNLDDYRPYFTYWITCLHVLVMICALSIYGVGPLGFGLRQQQKVLLKPSLSLERAGYLEPENFWIGPTPFALIHLGAKYAPCMRRDPVIAGEIEARRAIENETACCVRLDGSGCIQSVWEECQDQHFFDWKKVNPRRSKLSSSDFSSSSSSLSTYTVGTVCGLDPAHCANPASTVLRAWPNDLTRWPICRRKFETSPEDSLLPSHMTCDIIGKPCCIGIRGTCIITTQEYCQFVRGHFHDEAYLCSQVDCLADVCGMLPFATTEPDPTARTELPRYRRVPDQIYRLWISLFLHAGVIQLVITIVFQLIVMRDMEKLVGPLRIALLYFFSGMGANLGSAIFLPDRADAGPSGAQFGILACLLVELFQNWQILRAPSLALLKMMFVYGILLLLGFLPWVNNYSHVFGFIYGFLLSFCLMPYLTFGHFDKRRKLVTLVVAAFLVITLYTAMLVVFYVFPHASYACKYCKYFDCVPLERDSCNNHEIRINR